MKMIAFVLLFFVNSFYGRTQALSADFHTIPVNKEIKDFPDRFDVTSPLNSFLTYNYINLTGKNGCYNKVCSAANLAYFPDSTARDTKVSPEERARYLNTLIHEVNIYKIRSPL